MLKAFNNAIAYFIILIVILLIVPLPTQVLDFLFILNLALSLIILLITMSISEALEFSIYPSLLLLTTLFRLGLNVSSTRSILTRDGYAGEVIKTFGQYVIRGNVIVGLVIFLIIVLVQFIVITKGAERVAEVSARFTLDAMPGKQMAIDADLSSGIIDENEAKERREKIQREADFFGSMDGASKFVKGDAIMSIIITLINLIGGLIVGLVNGGDFKSVVQTYSIATVGDGLMSQIPALLISIATGMIVTRSAAKSDLNTEVLQQFSSQPRVLIIAGAVLPLLIIIGFPAGQVLLISAMLIAMGVVIQNRSRQAEATAAATVPQVTEEVTSEVSYYRNLDNVYGLLNVDAISVAFGYSLLPLVDEKNGNFLDRVVMLRKQFADEMGMVIPAIRLKDSSSLNPNQYEILLRGESVALGEVLVDHYLGLAPDGLDPANAIEGIDTVEPAFGMPAVWISEDKKLRAEMAGYTLIDPTSVIITHLSEIINRHAFELLTRQEVKHMLENLKKNDPNTIVDEVVPDVVTTSELQHVLKNLLREGVPIIDMEVILETLSDYAPTVKDSDMLTEYVRQSLKRTITRKFSTGGQLKVITLHSEIEDAILKSVKRTEGGAYLTLEPEMIQKIVTSTKEQIDKVRKLVQEPIVLTSPVVRVYYKKLIDQFYPNVTVLSFNDLDPAVQVQSLGVVKI